jgi:biopolymer transport protein ExbD
VAIRFRCQACSGLMSISSRKAGAMVTCATCGEQTLVPMEDIFDGPGFAVAAVPPELPRVEQPIVPSVAAPSEPPGQNATPNEEDSSQQFDEDSDPSNVPADRPDGEREVGDDVARKARREERRRKRREAEEEAESVPALTLRRRKRIDDEMDLTPMVDVTFQLLIFFMVTASFALQKSIQVPTPDPDQKGATQQMQMLEDLQGTSILVKIDAANAILIDDEPLADLSQLTEVLRGKMRKEQKTELLLTAHTAALHRGVIAVIDAANDAGMQKIRLASRKGKDD